jgi:predicted nucleic acid-binding protein
VATEQPVDRIAWDSCIIIDYLQRTKDVDAYKRLPSIVKVAEAGNLKIIVSMTAVAETVFIDQSPKKGGMSWADQDAVIRSFFDSEYIEPVAVGRTVAEMALALRRSHTLDWADSIHVATAVTTDCTHLLTRDGTGKKKKHPILKLDGKIATVAGRAALRIQTAEDYHQDRVAAAHPIVGPRPAGSKPYGPGVNQ